MSDLAFGLQKPHTTLGAEQYEPIIYSNIT